MFHLVIEQEFECSKAPTSDSVSSVFSWALLEELIAVLFLQEGRERGRGGGLIPFPSKLFFSNPSSNPTIPACVAQIEIPFPFFYCFFFCHETQSQCTKSHFPASKKGKSQLPFYPLTILVKHNKALARRKRYKMT